MLDKPGDELKLPITLGAPELVLVVRGRVQVSCKGVEALEGFIAYVALISAPVEGRRKGEYEARDCDCVGNLRRRSFD